MNDLGRIAYEAYFKATAGKNFAEQVILPSWDELGPQRQKAWSAAAQAVDDAGAIESPPAIPDLTTNVGQAALSAKPVNLKGPFNG
jgi:hypothetical protein